MAAQRYMDCVVDHYTSQQCPSRPRIPRRISSEPPKSRLRITQHGHSIGLISHETLHLIFSGGSPFTDSCSTREAPSMLSSVNDYQEEHARQVRRQKRNSAFPRLRCGEMQDLQGNIDICFRSFMKRPMGQLQCFDGRVAARSRRRR